MIKYKKIKRAKIVQADMHIAIMKWLNDNHRSTITLRNVWKVCEMLSNKLSNDGHFKTATITVRDEPIEKTMARVDRVLKKYDPK